MKSISKKILNLRSRFLHIPWSCYFSVILMTTNTEKYFIMIFKNIHLQLNNCYSFKLSITTDIHFYYIKNDTAIIGNYTVWQNSTLYTFSDNKFSFSNEKVKVITLPLCRGEDNITTGTTKIIQRSQIVIA